MKTIQEKKPPVSWFRCQKDRVVRFYADQDTIEKKIFWSVVPLSIFAGFASGIGTVVERLGLLACLGALLCVIGPIILAVRCLRTRDCARCYAEFCLLLNCFLMPFAFLTNGGLNSGMPMFCIGCLVLCCFCTNRRTRNVCFFSALAVYMAVFFASHYYTPIVVPIRSSFVWFDIILSYIVAGACLRFLIGAAIEEYNTQRYSDMNTGLIDSLGAFIEFRSLETGNHVKNIKEFTRILLDCANKTIPGAHFSKRDIAMISSAAVLHDIGKIAVPDVILQKPSSLTPEEESIMRKHPEDGCRLIETLREYQDPAYYQYCYEICRHHHERYNGSGYPDGLKGEEIPLISQIVALADVYDSLTANRVWSEAGELEQAKEMLLRGRPGEFSDQVLACFEAALPDLEKVVMSRDPLPKMTFSAGRSTRIGICLEDSKELYDVNETVLDYLEEKGIRSAVEVYPNPEDLLAACHGTVFDYLILGAEERAVKGMGVFGETSSLRTRTKFIFFCDGETASDDAENYHTVDLIPMPFTKSLLCAALDKAFGQQEDKNEQTLVLKTKGDLRVLRPDEVILSATDDHMQVIYTTDGEMIRLKKTGLEIFEMLEPYGCFARCGASYTLNLNHITSYTSNVITMSNMMKVTVPRRVQPELLEKYQSFRQSGESV